MTSDWYFHCDPAFTFDMTKNLTKMRSEMYTKQSTSLSSEIIWLNVDPRSYEPKSFILRVCQFV